MSVLVGDGGSCGEGSNITWGGYCITCTVYQLWCWCSFFVCGDWVRSCAFTGTATWSCISRGFCWCSVIVSGELVVCHVLSLWSIVLVMFIQRYKCKSNLVVQVRVYDTAPPIPNCTSCLYRNIGAVEESDSDFTTWPQTLAFLLMALFICTKFIKWMHDEEICYVRIFVC
jgi:hypothetical protein